MRRFRPGLLLLAALAVACATGGRPLPPQGEDYVFPSYRPEEVRPDESRAIHKAWNAILAGKGDEAEKAFLKLLGRHPGLVAAETGLGYARMRAGRLLPAAAAFASVLSRRADYLPALVGAGSVAVRRGDPETALALYRRAQAVDPEAAVVRRRLAEVKLRVTEHRVGAARAALGQGDVAGAVEEFRTALEAAPEVGGVRVELADLLAAGGDRSGAVALLEGDPGGDRQVLLRLGELLGELREYDRALGAYRRILSRDPKDAEALRKAMEARQALEFLRMPEEYRRIYSAPRITRADLAALVAVKVTALSRVAEGEGKVAIDISGSWAKEHILKVLAYDVMDVYPNHTFQPGAVVRRGDLARAVGRILDLVKWPAEPEPGLRDMSRSNLFYEGAARAVSAGLMDLTAEGAFEAWRPVPGRDAVDVVEALARLVGP